MKIGFVGMGNMGTTIANLIAENGYKVIGWDINESVVDDINKNNKNDMFLRGVKLSKKLKAAANIEDVMNVDFLFVALPSKFIENVLKPVSKHINKSTIVVNMAKGINRVTKKTSSAILKEIFFGNKIVMLSGPSIANEISQKMPTVVSLASDSSAKLDRLKSILDNNYFKTVVSTDILGTELAGILKNIYAIGLGVFDGLDIKSVNFRSIFLTLAVDEMAKIGIAMGAVKCTFYHVAGLGDLFATAMSEHSHNRKMGELLASGMSLEKLTEKIKILPEGYNTLYCFLEIAKTINIKIPLAQSLAGLIECKIHVQEFVDGIINSDRLKC